MRITINEYKSNNNREWYLAHKAQYQEANAQFESLLQELILKIGEKDGSILHNTPFEKRQQFYTIY